MSRSKTTLTTIAPRLGERAAIPAQERGKLSDGRELPSFYTGRITYINEAHRWYLVEADLGGVTLREGFHF